MTGLFKIRDRLDHRFARSNLSAYLDNQLTDGQKGRFERHLAVCPTCRQELASLGDTVALLRQAPLRPVPRSFTLPMTAQPEQARNRRWNLAYSYLRGATVVGSLLLVLLVSGDALIGMGAIPMLDLAPQSAKGVVMEVEATILVEDAVEHQAYVEAPATQGPLPTVKAPTVASLQKEKAVEAPAYPPTGGTPLAENAVPSARGGGRSGVASVPRASPSEPRPEATQAFSAGRVAPTASPVRVVVEHDAEPTSTAMPGWASPSPTSEPPTATLTRAPVRATVEPPPTMAKVAARSPQETKGQAPPAEAPGTRPLSRMWGVWRGVRTVGALLAGLLLILLAGMIWAGYKRRP